MMNLHTTISDQLLQMKDCKVNLYQMTEDDIAQSQSTTATEKEPVSEWMDCRVEADIDGDYTEILTVTVEDLSTLGFQVINNELTSYDNVQPDDSGDLKVVVKKEQASNLLSKALKKIRCAVCCQTFLHQRVWKSHLRSAHNGLKTYSCTKCHFKLQDDKTAPSTMAGRHRWILRHIRSHYSLRTHHCTYCVKCFSRNVLLKCHITNSCVARKEVNNGHKCSICQHSFHTLGKWLRHRYAHMRDINRVKYEVKPLTLLKKTKKMKKAKPVEVLKKRKLSKAVPTTWYDEEAPELEHNSVVQIKHEVDSDALSEEEVAMLYSCVVCGVNFSNIKSLHDHITTHDKEALSCCHICGEWFKTVSACNSHIATHTANTQKHECNICGATFRSLKNLKTHYLRHQIKVHSCVNCNETFATQQLLKKHRHDKHSAQKYICMECGQEFNRKTFLKQHELREHSAHRHKQICPICGHLWKFDYHVKDHLVACAKEFEMDAEGKKKLEGNLRAKCHTCKQTFPTLAELLSHISVHSKFDASYKCTTCPTSFVCYQDLMLHLAEHKEKPHRCGKCLEMFAEQQLLDDHTCVEYLNNYLESKPHCCDICLLRFVTRSGLHKHCRQKHNQKVQRIYPKRMERREDSSEGPLKCLYCSETFYTQSTFRVHVNKKHNSRLMYACDLCPRRFDTQALLQFHLVQVHAELKLYRCSTCANAYDSIHLLKQHLTSHPPGEERNQCECAFCGRRCPYPSILERHMRSHNNEKTETCTKCGKAFRDKHTLFYHMAIHNDQYAYVCKLCSKAFKSRASLYTHMQTHNSVRPKCTVCHKTFSTKYTLREHMVVHTREYARVCVICGRGFVYESLYESHLLQHVARGEGDTNTKIGAQNDSDILTVRNDNVLNDEDLSKAMETDDSVVCVLSLQDSMSYEKIIITNGEAGDERTDVVERPNSNVENIPANLEYDLGSLELTAMQE